jgi:serine/threonine protein kinase
MVYFAKEIKLEYDIIESTIYPILRTQMDIYTADSDNLFVRFYQSWVEGGSFFMIYEPATFTLASTSDEKRKLSEREIRSLLMDVSTNLIWLKDRRNFAHLNLKPENILNCRGKYKLMDMLCTLENMHRIHQTDDKYTAPELNGFYLDEVVDVFKCDIYSLGLIILENITGTK